MNAFQQNKGVALFTAAALGFFGLVAIASNGAPEFNNRQIAKAKVKAQSDTYRAKLKADMAKPTKLELEKAEQKRAAEAKFKAEGWWEQKPGIFIRWCGGKNAPCPGRESYQDYSWRAMVWCKERACGDIYAKLNISQNGTVVGWTNETAYGGYGQKVVLTFGSYTHGNGQLVEFIARG